MSNYASELWLLFSNLLRLYRAHHWLCNFASLIHPISNRLEFPASMFPHFAKHEGEVIPMV